MKKLTLILVMAGMLMACTLDENQGGDESETIGQLNKIYYTTVDNKKLFPTEYDGDTFGAILVSNTYTDGKGVLVFDDSVTSIGDYAFENCNRLTSVTIPDSVTSIEQHAFYGCNNLTSVIIPDSVTSIGIESFFDCTSLTSVTIGNSVTSIEHSSFENCSSLTNIIIPDSINSIGSYAFRGCHRLTSVYCKRRTPPTAVAIFNYWSAFSNNISGRKIYVPTSSVDAYRWALYWGEYASDIVGYDF